MGKLVSSGRSVILEENEVDTANNQSAGVVDTPQLSKNNEGTVNGSESVSGQTVITRDKGGEEPR